MKPISNMNEYKALKKFKVTPRFLAENLLENIDIVKSTIVITLSYEGVLNVAYSETDSNLETLGMIEYGKDLLKESMD